MKEKKTMEERIFLLSLSLYMLTHLKEIFFYATKKIDNIKYL